MADHAVDRLGGKTLLQHADTPYMDLLAKKGRCGRLVTVPDGYSPGSEVANTAILGYDLDKVYEGRGPLEAASIGYEMRPDDMAIRCNIITLADGKILNHHGGHLSTEDGTVLINYLNEQLGDDRVQFIPGIQYRHLLVIRGGNKHITCSPPHDHPDEPWQPLLVKPENTGTGHASTENTCEKCQQSVARLSPAETADLINDLILRSQSLLENHPINQKRKTEGKPMANSIWPWSPGYRPSMQTIAEMYPEVKTGVVDGATGLYNTNYEGKAQAAIEALKNDDFVFLHVEASDEAGHDGDLDLKLRTIEYLDRRIVEPIYNEVKTWDEPVAIALLPDHPTPVETRTHVKEPVPFVIYHPGIEADGVKEFDEVSCVSGAYGLLQKDEFMKVFMND